MKARSMVALVGDAGFYDVMVTDDPWVVGGEE